LDRYSKKEVVAKEVSDEQLTNAREIQVSFTETPISKESTIMLLFFH
jgi:hypothetical protein